MVKNFPFLITLIAATFGNPARAASPPSKDTCHSRTRSALDAAADKARAGQNLLALLDINAVRYNECATLFRSEIAVRSAQSLLALGERAAALSELHSARKVSDLDQAWDARAVTMLAIDFGETPSDAAPSTLQRLKLWKERDSSQGIKLLPAYSALPATSRESIDAVLTAYDLRPRRSPLAAGLLSTVLPGAGQAYNGHWQSAATSTLLNALFLLSTIQLANKKLGFPAAVTGLAFSTVYLGNIISAVTGAKRINEESDRERDRQLRERLFEANARP